MKFKFIIFVIPTIFLLSCSTTKITSMWKAEIEPQSSYSKTINLVMMGDEDRTLQKKIETHISGDFKGLGYNGISGYSVFGPKALKGLNEAAIMQQMHDENVVVVMLISLLDKKMEKYYVPVRSQYTPYSIYCDRFGTHYNMLFERTYSEGYYREDNRYFQECNFYDVRSGKLLYSSISDSFDPGSIEGLAHQYGAIMMSDLVKEKILVDKISKATTQK